MRLVSNNCVPPVEHHPAWDTGIAADWENLRVFLETGRRGSFRSCSQHLGLPLNRVRRRIESLERQLGATLLVRDYDGVRLTREGQNVLAAAAQMEAASLGLLRTKDQTVHGVEGVVRVAVTDGLGTFWLIPRLIDFQRAYPRLLVDLQCALAIPDVLRRETDISVQIQRPTASNLKVVRLGRQYIAPFASPSYINTFGQPSTWEELLARHRIVLLTGEQGKGQEYYDQYFPGKPQLGFVALHTNSSSAHYWGVASGAGIGWLPTYVAAFGGGVVPIDLEPRIAFDIWLTYHPDAARIPRVRRMKDWLIDAFDPRKFPWFRDEFIPSGELLNQYRGKPLVNLFTRFLGAEAHSAGGARQSRTR